MTLQSATRMRHPLLLGGVVLAISATTACRKSGTPYDRLCRVYEEVQGQPTTPELAARLTAKAEKEIPELSEDLLLLANASADQRYELLRTMAEQKAGQKNWRCEAIRQWYPPRAAP